MRTTITVRLSAVLVAVGMALAGCSGTTTPSAPGSEGSGGAAKLSGTLTFANWQWLEPGRGDTILAAVKKYETKNPNAKIQKQEITRADYEKTISTQIGAGAGPDILIVPDPFFPELVSAGALEPVDDVVQASTGLRDSNNNYKADGKQMSILWEAVPYALVWNKALLDKAGVKPPTTVDELAAAAKAIKDKTGKTGFVVRHQMNEESPWWTDYSNWVFGYGGAWSDGKALTLNSQENVDALAALQKVYKSGGFGVGDDASTYRSKFSAGEVGMMIDNSSAALTVVSKAGGIKPTDIASAPLPFPKGGSAYAGFSIGINSQSKNKDLAKDFLKWMLSSEAQPTMADALFPSGIATPTKPSDTLTAQNPWVDGFYKQLDKSSGVVIKGFEASTPQVRTIVLTEVARCLSTGISPKEAMGAAQQKAASIKP